MEETKDGLDVTRRTRRDSYAKYLQNTASDGYLDPLEQRGIELLAKLFRLRLLGRRTWANGTDDRPNPDGNQTPTES